MVTPKFVSPAAFVDFMLDHYGPTHTAAQRLDEHARAALRDDLVALAHEANGATDGTFVSDWAYCVVTATRTS